MKSTFSSQVTGVAKTFSKGLLVLIFYYYLLWLLCSAIFLKLVVKVKKLVVCGLEHLKSKIWNVKLELEQSCLVIVFVNPLVSGVR